MLQWGFALLRWLLTATALMVGLAIIVGQFEEQESRFPSPRDLADVNATPPPDFRLDKSHSSPRGRRSLSQRIGGAMAASEIEDPRWRGLPNSANNFPVPLPTDHTGRGLYLLVSPSTIGAIHTRYPSSAVAIVNATEDMLVFESIQGNLPTIQEALDSDGQWRPIEFFPDPRSSSLLRKVYLPSKHYWITKVRSYSGELTTRSRLTLELPNGRRLISNEYEQGIFLSQFEPSTVEIPTDSDRGKQTP